MNKTYNKGIEFLECPKETSTPVGNIIYQKQKKSGIFMGKKEFVQKEVQMIHQHSRQKYIGNDSIKKYKDKCVFDEERLHNANKSSFWKSTSKQFENSSLEEHIFHDLSYTQIVSTNPINNGLCKLNGTIYECDFSSLSDDEVTFNIYINHQRRSQFRQNRRDWYLNRNIMEKTSKLSWLQIIYKYLINIFAAIFIVLSETIPKYLERVYILFTNGYNNAINYSNCKQFALDSIAFIINVSSICRFWNWPWVFIDMICHQIKTLLKEVIVFYKTTKALIENKLWKVKFTASLIKYFQQYVMFEEIGKEVDAVYFLPCCCTLILVAVLLMPVLLLFIGLLSQANTYVAPESITIGISKSQMLFLGGTGSIPAWHFVPPSSTSLTSNLDDKLPVVFYIRETRDLQKNIIQTLVSIGYHVIAPVHAVSDEEVSIAWSHINKKVSPFKSSVYLWGDHLDAGLLTGYAKDFCLQLIPPSGVILETKVNTEKLEHRSLEIWSCNCTHVKNKKNGRYHKYTHVKCPLNDKEMSQEEVYDYIISCIQAVNREP